MLDFKNEQHKMHWDDLRFVMAVAKAGSLIGAASLLGSSHPTVFRRVKAIEARLGVRLFERSRNGYSATEAAEDMIALAAKIEVEIDSLEMRIAGSDARPTGLVRLTTTDTLMSDIFPPVIAHLNKALPAIQFDISTANDMLSLNKREADIAIRPGGKPPDHLIGRRLCSIAVTIYAPTTWEGASMNRLADFPWLAPDDTLSHLASARWLQNHGLTAKAVMRSNSLLNLAAAAKAGLGLAILPCYLGDRAPTLKRLGPPMKAFESDLWILSHPDLRKVRRINAVIEAMQPALLAMADLFEGRAWAGN